VKTNKHASFLSPHLPPSSRFLSGGGRAQGWAGWRREVFGRQILVLVLKILLFVLKILLFIKIVLFVFQEKLVFQIKLILSPIKIIQLSWISICGSSSI